MGRARASASSRCAVRGSPAPTTCAGPEDEAENAVKFDDGWLRTGDVGSLTPDGFLRLTDRAKDVIKSGGEWISSVDLENHLMAHPKVLEASVIGVPDEQVGRAPAGHRRRRRRREPGRADELRATSAERVARWQVPERWAFIAEVPKTSVGKFDKKVLRRQYAEGELEVLAALSAGRLDGTSADVVRR